MTDTVNERTAVRPGQTVAIPTRAPLLEVESLTVDLMTDGDRKPILRDVSLALRPGEALGLVGESGSGKSMTVKAIDRLLPAGAHMTGTIRFDGRDVQSLSGTALRSYRGEVAMVFQDPRVAINPVRRIGDFMTEALRTNQRIKPGEAAKRAAAMLDRVGIPDGDRRLHQYPHELSGGLLQRVMIATTLLTSPRLLLADEPTTALDVSTQAEIVAILNDLRQDFDLSVLFITHDLELASSFCDRTAVMYAGEIVETRESSRLHDDPLHPYTAALAAARPSIEQSTARLAAIPGRPLAAAEAPPEACAFAARCVHRQSECETQRPPLVSIDGDVTRCLRAPELRGQLGGER